MPSARSNIARRLIIERSVRKASDYARSSPLEVRQALDRLAGHAILPRGTVVERIEIDGLYAEWIRGPGVPAGEERTILYFHGGGYVSGSCRTHRDLAARLSAASGVRVLLPEYRLAPENRFPAALEDGLRVFRRLEEGGTAATEIVLGGDSAGGGLVLMVLFALRDEGSPLPAAAFMLSPWLSASPDGESYAGKASVDPLLTREDVEACALLTLGEDGDRAALTPLFEDLHGLPPVLVQVGKDEILLSDSERFGERARAAGVEVELEVWEGMWHVFQSFAVVVPEARRAVARIGEFVRAKL
jgi:monoterpene epsilon-lactone hydrolase